LADEPVGFQARGAGDRATRELGEGTIVISVEENGILFAPEGGADYRVSFDSIRKIRFGSYAAERLLRAPVIPELRVWTGTDDSALEFDGLEDSLSYPSFVYALYARIEQKNPGAIVETGLAASYLWLFVAIVLVAFVGVVSSPSPAWAIVAFGALIVFAAYVIHRRTYPRRVTSAADLERAFSAYSEIARRGRDGIIGPGMQGR
jgi:hypothetical protein